MPKRAANPTPNIPDSELEVLKVLWDRGQGTVRELLEAVRGAGLAWSYATVATLLDRLEAKGLVSSDRSELAFVYRPLITEHEVQQRRISGLVDKLYHGEPGLLVMHLLKAHPLAPEQAREVRDILDQMAREAAQGVARATLGGPDA